MTASTSTVWAAAGINIAVTAIVGSLAFTTLSNQWSTSNTLGQHTSTLSSINGDVLEVRAQVDKANVGIQDLRRQIQTAQTDVSAVLAKAGILVDPDITWASVGREIVAFPQTEEAAGILKAKNFSPVQLTPAVGGYALDDASAKIVRDVLDSQLENRTQPFNNLLPEQSPNVKSQTGSTGRAINEFGSFPTRP